MNLPIFLSIFRKAPKNGNNFHAKDCLQFGSAGCYVDHLSTWLGLAEAFLKWRGFLALPLQMSGVTDSTGTVRGGNQQTDSLVSLFVFSVISFWQILSCDGIFCSLKTFKTWNWCICYYGSCLLYSSAFLTVTKYLINTSVTFILKKSFWQRIRLTRLLWSGV